MKKCYNLECECNHEGECTSILLKRNNCPSRKK